MIKNSVFLGAQKANVPKESRIRKTCNKGEHRGNKENLEDNRPNRKKPNARKSTAKMVKQRRVKPHIAKNNVGALADKKDVLTRLAKVEDTLNKMVPINN